MKALTHHLDSVEESYFQHFRHAMSFAVHLFVASLACLVHALAPFLFEKTGSRRIEALHQRMVVNRDKLTPAHRKTRRGARLESAA